MAKRTRFQELQDAAAESGLHVATWSPGDGVTRYRFFDRPGNSYFGPANGIATTLGMKKAWEFVYAYGAGQPRRDPAKPKKERYRMAYKHKTSFHRLGEGIIGRTTGSELHLASAESWREQASRTDDPKRKREFLAHARAHEKRAGSKGMQESHRRVLEGQLWKIWPKEYKFIMNRVRAIRMKTRDGYEDKELQYLTDEEIMHLLHPARRDPGSRRGSTEIVPESSRHHRVYFEKGAARKTSSWHSWRPGYYIVVAETTKPGMHLVDEDRASRTGERAFALAKSPRGGALWVLAKNTRPVRQRRA